MINATPLAPLALPPNLPPSSCFAPLLPLDAADSRAATALSPAQQEFSSLQAWLSAPQLPLHQVECQQEQKGRALQRRELLLGRGEGRGCTGIRCVEGEQRRFRPTSPLLPASRRCSPSTQRIPVQPRPSPLPSKSSLLCRPGCPPRAPCNCPCTKSSASRSRRGVPCSAYCFRRTSNSGDRGTWVAPYT